MHGNDIACPDQLIKRNILHTEFFFFFRGETERIVILHSGAEGLGLQGHLPPDVSPTYNTDGLIIQCEGTVDKQVLAPLTLFEAGKMT